MKKLILAFISIFFLGLLIGYIPTLASPGPAKPNPGHTASEIGGDTDAERTFNSTGKYTFLGNLDVRGSINTSSLYIFGSNRTYQLISDSSGNFHVWIPNYGSVFTISRNNSVSIKGSLNAQGDALIEGKIAQKVNNLEYKVISCRKYETNTSLAIPIDFCIGNPCYFVLAWEKRATSPQPYYYGLENGVFLQSSWNVWITDKQSVYKGILETYTNGDNSFDEITSVTWGYVRYGCYLYDDHYIDNSSTSITLYLYSLDTDDSCLAVICSAIGV